MIREYGYQYQVFLFLNYICFSIQSWGMKRNQLSEIRDQIIYICIPILFVSYEYNLLMSYDKFKRYVRYKHNEE